MLTFDEIENASPGISPSDHWRNNQDFILFWQTLRSLFQRKKGLFSYLIVGTNPSSNEQPKIGDIDNPIFAQFPKEYIPRFSAPQTREMVRRLGKLMGLNFDEYVYAQLTEDFGGHPYLIRHVCSVIHRIADAQRPVDVGKALYERARKQFIREGRRYFEMILTVLKQHYPDEYEMLKFLAVGDKKSFAEFANSDPAYTEHLTGYDPQHDPARIRAFFVHPAWARRGIGRTILLACETAIRADGFQTAELVATRYERLMSYGRFKEQPVS